MSKKLLLFAALLLGTKVFGQSSAEIKLDVREPGPQISKHIYGQFSEHLGRSIYGGFWVDPKLKVAKKDRIRLDVVEALKKIKIPNLRWPGGCFADEYHWRDGIGLRSQRPKMVNTNWGGVVEDNSFGTHEFLELCELLHCEPYISANVGSGTVEEMAKWVEYLNFDGESPMSKLRALNGHPKPFKVTFWGVGNESWGCGGDMLPQYYADLYRRYATYARNYPGTPLKKIASGPNVDDYRWTDTVMRKDAGKLWGLSLHYYTVPKTWGDKGSATNFEEKEYFTTVKKSMYMEELITKHAAIMDKYDPEKKVGLVVDEWGVWTNVEPNTNPGFLYQQNSMRDAIIAGTTLNIFNNHADRVRMANLAQTVNVLQSLILTENEKMLLTPTYHVFDLYQVHQNATLLPLKIKTDDYEVDGEKIPAINASASKDSSGVVHISLVNVDAKNSIRLNTVLAGLKWSSVKGEIVTSAKFNDYNTFQNPNKITTKPFNGASKKGEELEVNMPPLSVVVLTLR